PSLPRAAATPRLQPAQKPMFSAKRSARAFSQWRSTSRQLPSAEPESTTMHSASSVAVFAASASSVRGRQLAPLWLTSTIESSGLPAPGRSNIGGKPREVGVDHQPDQLPEGRPRLPRERLARLGGVAHKVVDLRRPKEARVRDHVLL